MFMKKTQVYVAVKPTTDLGTQMCSVRGPRFWQSCVLTYNSGRCMVLSLLLVLVLGYFNSIYFNSYAPHTEHTTPKQTSQEWTPMSWVTQFEYHKQHNKQLKSLLQ